MSGQEDTRLVDHLYGELSEKEAAEYRRALDEDPALREELESFEKTLGTLRAIEEEDPAPHLDSLILAHARQEADALAETQRGFFARLKKLISSPVAAIAVTASVAAVVAIVTIPTMMLRSGAPSADMQSSSRGQPVVLEQQAVKDSVAAEAKPKKEQLAKSIEEPLPTVMAPAQEPAGREMNEKLARAEMEEAQPELDATRKGDEGGERREAKKRVARANQAAEKPAEKLAEKSFDKPASTPVEEPQPADELANKTGGVALGGAGVGGDADGVGSSRSGAGRDRAKESPPVQTQPSAAMDDARDEVVSIPEAAAGKKDKAERRPEPSKPAKNPINPQEQAQSFIRAAESQLDARDANGARRILLRGMQALTGTPAFGAVALRLAQLEFQLNRFAEAAKQAKVAADTPNFAGRQTALALERRAQLADESVRASKRVDTAKAAKRATEKASEAAPTSADEAESK